MSARARPLDRFLTRLTERVDDREAVALRVVRPLLGECDPRPHEDLDVVLGLGNGLDERVLEDAQDVAHSDAVRAGRRPGRIDPACEVEERVVRGAAVQALDERRELRGEAAVHLDDLRRPLVGDEELDVEERIVEAVGEDEAFGERAEFSLALVGEACRVLEPLEADRSRVHQRVGDPD